MTKSIEDKLTSENFSLRPAHLAYLNRFAEKNFCRTRGEALRQVLDRILSSNAARTANALEGKPTNEA